MVIVYRLCGQYCSWT